MNNRLLIKIVSLLAFFMALSGEAPAQTAPSLTEQAGYTGLHVAAFRGDVGDIRRLIAKGADLELKDSHGRTPLHVAAYQSHDEILNLLVGAGADINAFENDAYDVITIAAVANDLGVLRRAISLGGNPGNITSPYIGTALIAAAHLGHVDVVKTLINAGAPLDHVNNLGWTALIESVVLGDGGPDHVETARALIEAGADVSISDNQGVTPLEHANRMGFRNMVALFPR
jgi:uncharacterized protein